LLYEVQKIMKWVTVADWLEQVGHGSRLARPSGSQ